MPDVRLLADDLVPDHALDEDGLDAFKHAAIAARLADLVAQTSTPVNVALFGAWGSGKSSVYELLRRSLEERRDKRVQSIRYDAWKFGGQALQRNFISHAANELGLREKNDSGEPIRANRAFHRGLYERQRRAEVDFAAFDWKNLAPARFFFGAFLVFAFLFALVTGTVSVLTDEDFLGQIGKTLPAFLVPAGVIGAVTAAAKAVVDGTTVDVEQSQPSADEEFSRVFADLRDLALKRADRLVFFIDELDRCSPSDVVATLTALRTFLDQRDCVFVVAADREVLESALVELPQATPFDEENPYYSSASSFLDKVFQHQLPLPPLRGRRLTRYARDLVLDRGGMWEELRAAEPSGRRLDGVIYALIPGHVRSPRRVKVLLNNFATNVRIAESRGIDWLARAREIAKLTVLQTEFPLLAADLHHEPRLPSFLLAPPAGPSERLERLLRKHRGLVREEAEVGAEGDLASRGLEGDADEETGALTAPLLIDDSDEEAQGRRQRLAAAEQRQLVRYLQRTEATRIPDPGRDLLYLEAAGAAVGFEDPERGETVENDAPEAPKQLVRVSRDWSVADQQGAVRLLADMADQEFGDERANVMTALLGIARGLGDAVDSVGDVAVESIKSFLREQSLAADLLPDALNLAVRVEPGDDGPLTEQLLSDNELFEDTARTADVATMLDVIPTQLRPLVYIRVADALEVDSTVLWAPLARLTGASALELLNEQSIRDAIRELDELRMENLASQLFEAIDAREGSEEIAALGLALYSIFADAPAAYPVLRERAADVLPSTTAGLRAELALTSLTHAAASDWAYWAGLAADAVPDEGTSLPFAAAAACISLIADADMGDEEARRGLGDVFAVAAPCFDAGTDELPAQIGARLRERLYERAWWADEDAFTVQSAWHQAAWRLRAEQGSAITRTVESVLAADLQRALEATDVDRRGVTTYAATQPLTLRGLRQMGEKLLKDSAAWLLEQLDEAAAALEDDDRRLTVTVTRIALARAVVDDEGEVEFEHLPVEDVLALPFTTQQPVRRWAAVWIRLNPAFDDVVSVLNTAGAHVDESMIGASDAWGARLDEALRTAALETLIANATLPTALIQAVAKHGYDEATVLDRLATMVQAGTRIEDRTRAVRLVLAAQPSTHPGQRKVADIIIMLLARGTKADFKLASEAVQALGSQHRSAERIRRAFTNAATEHDLYLDSRYLAAMSAARINVPQKLVEKRDRGFWRSLFGRKRDP